MFKVGDWVRDVTDDSVHQVINEDIVNGKYSSAVKWQPKVGEWCWFYDTVSSNPLLMQFEKQDNDKFYGKTTELYFREIEPFIGQLPTFLKEQNASK